MPSARRNISLDDALWDRIRRAAAEEGARRGRTVSVSEWLREAAEGRLADARKPKSGPRRRAK